MLGELLGCMLFQDKGQVQFDISRAPVCLVGFEVERPDISRDEDRLFDQAEPHIGVEVEFFGDGLIGIQPFREINSELINSQSLALALVPPKLTGNVSRKTVDLRKKNSPHSENISVQAEHQFERLVAALMGVPAKLQAFE